MRKTRKSQKSISAVLVFTACIVAGIAGGSAVAYAASPSDASPDKPDSPVYSVNSSGQSFGSAQDATSTATEPDLIEAIATNGEVGYVNANDLTLPANSPEENIRNNDVYAAGFAIPVYQSDGKTVIGEFIVGGPSSLSAEESEKLVRGLE